MRLDRLTVFNHLWAIAGFCEWTRWTFTETGWSWVLLVASLALLVFPRSVACLALFAAVQSLFTALAANRPWNHGLFMALMNLASWCPSRDAGASGGRPSIPSFSSTRSGRCCA